MRSCQEMLGEIREKIINAEEQLLLEKKNLYKTDELFAVEKDKWAKELKVEQLKIHLNEKELKKKETKLETLKSDYEEKLKKYFQLESENEQIKKEIQKARKNQQEESNKQLLEIAKLEKVLNRIQDRQKDVRKANKWVKVFQEKELKVQETENENKLKDETKLVADEFAKKVEAFEDSLKDIEKFSLRPKQQKLREMQESLAMVRAQCEELERKNREVENEISALENIEARQKSNGIVAYNIRFLKKKT